MQKTTMVVSFSVFDMFELTALGRETWAAKYSCPWGVSRFPVPGSRPAQPSLQMEHSRPQSSPQGLSIPKNKNTNKSKKGESMYDPNYIYTIYVYKK